MPAMPNNSPVPPATRGFEQARWEVDRSHSSVSFTIRHMAVATVAGAFDRFAGELETGPAGLCAAGGTVEVDSLYTGERRRDEVLLGKGFLDVEGHPQIRFDSRRIQNARGAVQVDGELTIRGARREVILTGVVEPAAVGPGEPQRLALSARGTISRSEFGVTGGGLLERVGAALSDQVKIAVALSAVRIDDE